LALAGAGRFGYGGASIMRALFLLAALALLAACGNMEPLRPKAGEAMPVKPAMAARAPTTEELLTPPPNARPARQDDGLRRSEEREDDPFDLPPTG
jgi:predicted small lipoprotein YifL